MLVRREKRGERYQRFEQGGAYRVACQGIAAPGGEHRIDDQRSIGVPGDDRGHRAHVFGRSEHAELERSDPRLGKQRARLSRDQIGRDRFQVLDAARVLHREPGHHRQRMAAERREREQIGLQSRSAGGIRRGEGQNDRWHELISGPIFMTENQVQFKTWMCLICGFVYDEAAGLPDEGIAPGTRWEDVPMNWTCPECGARKEDFEMVEI